MAISHSDSLRANIGLEVYLQTMLAGGFISMGSDLIGMVRSLLVGTTIGTRMRPHIKLTPQHFHRAGAAAPSTTDASSDAIVLKDAQVTEREAARGEGVGDGEGSEGVVEVVEVEDYPEMRARIRSICGIGQLLFLVAVILGIIAGVDYQSAAKSGEHAELVRRLWCVLFPILRCRGRGGGLLSHLRWFTNLIVPFVGTGATRLRSFSSSRLRSGRSSHTSSSLAFHAFLPLSL